MNRRSWLLVGAGAAATVAGAAWQWRHQASRAESIPQPAGEGPMDKLWQSKFTQPDGQVLDVLSWRGQPIVINFWATWCPPCLKEMPEIDRFARQFSQCGGRVLGLAVDNPSAVAAYLARLPVSYTIGLAGFDGTELSRHLGNNNGGLPFTVAIHRAGHVAHRRLGETSFDELTAWSTTLG